MHPFIVDIFGKLNTQYVYKYILMVTHMHRVRLKTLSVNLTVDRCQLYITLYEILGLL